MLNVTPRFLVCFLVSFQCSLFSTGQSFDFGFKHLTTDNGLSHDLVQTIAKDKQGFMWFGTLNGLNRFDGFQFKVFKHKKNDSTSIPHNTIVDLVCDTSGYLWMSTGNGVCRYDPFKQNFRTIILPNSNESQVWHLSLDDQGMIIVLHGGYLYHIRSNDLQISLVKKLSPLLSDARLFNGGKNGLWLVNRSAVYRYDRRTGQETYVMGDVEKHHDEKFTVSCVYADPTGTTWIGTQDKGLFYYDHITGKAKLFSMSRSSITSMTADVDYSVNNLLWIGGSNSGLQVLNTKTLQVYDMPKNLQQSWTHNGSRINSFFRDTSNGILWLGTDFGIEKYDPGTARFAKKILPASPAEAQLAGVNAVMLDKTDTTGNTWWVCTAADGFYKWQRDKDEFVNYAHKLKDRGLLDIEQDSEGNIWIAGTKGIQIFNPVRNSCKLVDSFISHDSLINKVMHLYKDSRGNIWFSQDYDGLFTYDCKTKQIKRQNLHSVLQKPERVWITAITGDSLGNVWVASADHIFRISNSGELSRFVLKPIAESLKNGGAFGIAIDSKGVIWFTNGAKLFKAAQDGSILKIFGEDEGIISGRLQTILVDKQGFLWISSDNSLHRFDPVTEQFRYYKKEDGLFTNNIPAQVNLAENGELFIGFNNAFSYTDTRRSNDRTISVPFIFTDIQVEDKMVSPINASGVVLQSHENTLLVEYAALDYSRPEKIQYAYWIEQNGVDTQWNITSQRSLTFTNLGAGDYMLHVKVRGPNGTMSKEELKLMIKVMPKFYETWWFWALVIGVIAGILYLFYLIRKEQQTRLEKMRDRIATDLHDDMGSTLSSIRIFSDVVKRQVIDKEPQSVPLLDRISNNAAQLSENMQDIIWTIKQDNDKLEDLVTRMREFGLKLCDAKDIEFKVHISDSFRTSRLNLEQRRNLYLIFKECLNNAIKYSGCDIIQLFITQQGKHLKMVLQDNGKGFNEPEIKKGNGLNNIYKRAKEINGNATIESGNGNGTRVDVLIKLL